MRAYVFTDKALASEAGRFVWLSENTERAVTAGFQKQFPFPAWPTFFVIDPRDEHVALRWIGQIQRRWSVGADRHLCRTRLESDVGFRVQAA